MARKVPSLNLPPANDLFSTQEERDDVAREKIMDIALSDIDAFPEHPFKVDEGEALQSIIESIIAIGVQTPAVVRLKEDGRYEMISGHRRKLACELAGLESIPCIVRTMNHDEAVIAMVDANLQREVILPSERAKSYKMKLVALKHQGKRTDLTSPPMVGKSIGKEAMEIVGEAFGESREQVRRYIRLTELVPELLDMVDDSKLALRPAVEISYLTKEQQQALLKVIVDVGRIPTHVQAMELRKLSEEDGLTNDAILSIMNEDKSAPSKHFKLSGDKIRKFFPTGTSAEVVEDTIIKALELWHSSNK